MAGMGAGMMGSMIDTGIQGAQNTSKQEYNQRQALFQNLVAANSDSAWLMQHFPGFYSWNTQGNTGSYEAASNAPQAYAGNPIKSDFAGAMGADADRKQKQPVMDSEAAYKNFLSGGGKPQSGGQSSYSSLWS